MSLPQVLPHFDHVNIVVSDMPRSVHFYRTLFGMTVRLDCELEGTWFEAVTGLPGAVAHCVILCSTDEAFRIELLRYTTPAGKASPGTSELTTEGLRHFAVRVDDLALHLSRARAIGYGLNVEPVSVPFSILPAGKRMAYIRDPDGAVIELAEYGAGNLVLLA